MLDNNTRLPLEVNDNLQISNYADLLKLVQSINARYSKLVTDAKDARKTRTKLRRLSRQLNKRRIAIKRNYMSPYNRLKDQVKNLQSYIDSAASHFTGIINDDKKKRKQRLAERLQPDMDEVCALRGIEKLPVPKDCLKFSMTKRQRLDVMVGVTDNLVRRRKLSMAKVVNNYVINSMTGEIVPHVVGRQFDFIGDKDDLKALKKFAKKHNLILNNRGNK